jgi:hypothetical protein
VQLPIKCTFDHLGLILETDPMSHRNIIVDVQQYSSVSQIDWQELLQFHTIIQIDLIPVFTCQEVHTVLQALDLSIQASATLLVAPYRPEPKDQDAPLPQIALNQLRVIHHVLHGWDLADPVLMVSAANAITMAHGQKHTRRTCLRVPDRDKWITAEFAQLDKHHSYGMYGQPVARHQVPADSKVVLPIWNYSQKAQGEHKARKCMDGKQLVRMGTKIGNTYAACMEQHILRLFVAIIAYLGNIIGDGDVVNAYTHAPSQGITIYIAVDEVFQAWYLARLKIDLSLGTCVPLLGHARSS